MTSFSGNNQPYAPSAPPASDTDEPRVAYPYQSSQPPSNSNLSSPYAQITHTHSSSYGSGPAPSAQSYGFYNYQPPQQNVYSAFPPGTHPDIIRSFQMVDRNQNGYIEETELREALAWNYKEFSLSTLRLLIFLFRDPRESSLIIGPLF